MAREIKFRGRNGNMWVYGNLHVRKHDEYGDSAFIIGSTEKPATVQVDVRTVGQFTGIKDCKGREIYEGDILEYYNDITKKSHVSGHVVYDEYKAAFNIVNPKDGSHLYIMPTDDGIDPHLTVIGNIHSNPELLKGTRK